MIKKQPDIIYKGFTIEHFPMEWHYADKTWEQDSYIIHSPYYLQSNPEKPKVYLPLYPEDEYGVVQQFKSLEEAKEYIDKWMISKKGKFKNKGWNQDECHFEILPEYRKYYILKDLDRGETHEFSSMDDLVDYYSEHPKDNLEIVEDDSEEELIGEALKDNLEEADEKEYYYNYDVLCDIYYKGGVIHRDEEAYAKSYEDLCQQVRDDWEYEDDLDAVEEYGSIEIKVNYTDDPAFKGTERYSKESDDTLEEDIEKHDILNPLLFENNELKPDVKEAIEKIAKAFTDGLAEDGVKFTLKDIVLLGSNCSYNYTKDSDLDIHLIADSSDLHCPDELYPLLYSAYRSMFNKNYDITIKGIPAEIYVEMDKPQAKSNGIYSLNTGWIKEPVQQDIPDLDEEEFDKLFTEWEDKYFDLLSKIGKIIENDTENDPTLVEKKSTSKTNIHTLLEDVLKDHGEEFDYPKQEDIDKCKEFIESKITPDKFYKSVYYCTLTWLLALSDRPVRDDPMGDDKQGQLAMFLAALQLAADGYLTIWKVDDGWYNGHGNKDFLFIKVDPAKNVSDEDALKILEEFFKENWRNPNFKITGELIEDPQEYL